MSRKTLPVAVLLVIGIVAAVAMLVRTVQVNSPPLIDMENVIFEDHYQLNDTIDGDAVIIGSEIALGENSVINGDASFVGETVLITGEINGDLAIAAAEIQFQNARIGGDTVLMANKIVISGTFNGGFSVTGDSVVIDPASVFSAGMNVCASVAPTSPDGTVLMVECQDETVFQPLETLVRLRREGLTLELTSTFTPASVLVIGALMTGVMAGIASLAVTIFPRQISRIEDAVRATPRRLIGVGLAVFGLGIGLSLALVVMLAMMPPLGFILIPVYLALGLGMLTLTVTGWVTLSLVIGDRVVTRAVRGGRSGRGMPPLLIAAVGSVILSAVLTGLALLPFGCVITLLTLAGVTSAGVGAGMLTRLGTRPLSRATFVQG